MPKPTKVELLAEINTDTYDLGLLAVYDDNQDGTVANLLNDRTGAGAGSVAADPISSQDFVALFKGLEVGKLLITQQGTIDIYTNPGQVNIGDDDVQEAMLTIFTVGDFPDTRAAIIAASTRTGSAAERLWGTNTQISSDDVYQTRIP